MEAAKIHLAENGGYNLPLSHGSAEEEYWAIRQSAGYCDISHRARLLVSGEDAPRFLQGMATSDVAGMTAGQGSRSFFLNVQGHILALANVFRLAETRFLIDAEPQSYDAIAGLLNRHIIMDAVEVEDVRESLVCIAIEGPRSEAILSGALKRLGCGEAPSPLASLAPLAIARLEQVQGWIARASYAGGEGFWAMVPQDHAPRLMDCLGQEGGARAAGWSALETCRIENGVPRYGADITERNLLQESGLMDTVSFTKGCYIGQEVVERIRSRGHVNRKLMQLHFEGRREIPAASGIIQDGHGVGYAGSSAYSFAGKKTIAFGYLRRECAVAGATVTCADMQAVVTELTRSGPLRSSNRE